MLLASLQLFGANLSGWCGFVSWQVYNTDGCTDKCFPILKLHPALAKIATTMCQKLLHTTPPATAYTTITTTFVTTSTPKAPTNTITSTVSTTVTVPTLCSTTITQAVALTTSYGFTQQHVIKKRHEEKQQESLVQHPYTLRSMS